MVSYDLSGMVDSAAFPGSAKSVDPSEHRVYGLIHFLLEQESLVPAVDSLRRIHLFLFLNFDERTVARQLFKMHMWAGRSAAIPRKGYDRAGFDHVSRLNSNDGVMPIEGAVPVGMFNNNGGTMAAVSASKDDSSLADRVIRGAGRDGDIDPAVKNKFAAAKRVYPPPHAGGNESVLYRQGTIRPGCHWQTNEDHYREEERFHPDARLQLLEQRRAQIPFTGVRQHHNDHLAFVFRPLGDLQGGKSCGARRDSHE